jgi:hypothetical protein
LRGGYTADPLISFTRTMMYSVLGDDAPTGLAYYFLKQEMPAALPKFKAEMERLTAPALKLIRQSQFVAQWEALNPWTAANVLRGRSCRACQVNERQRGQVSPFNKSTYLTFCRTIS